MGVIGFVADIKSVMFLSGSIPDKSCDNERGSKPVMYLLIYKKGRNH